MRINELQRRISSLQCGIAGKRASVSQLEARLAQLEEARTFAVRAQEEAEGIVRSTTCFALATWAGRCATAFMDAVSEGGNARHEAVRMHEYCQCLVQHINDAIIAARSERDALAGSIAADQRSVDQAWRSINRLRKAR